MDALIASYVNMNLTKIASLKDWLEVCDDRDYIATLAIIARLNAEIAEVLDAQQG
jgi:hypothetical protein